VSREIDDAIDLSKHLDKQYKSAIERGNREDGDELFVKMRRGNEAERGATETAVSRFRV
jgi:hypothetical protein